MWRKNCILYGEIYGKGIQDLTYGKEDYDIALFDVKIGDQYLGWDQTLLLSIQLDMTHVPICYVGPYSKEVVDKFTTGTSLFCKEQIREGCVVKPIKEVNDKRIGRKILKSVSTDYLLRANAS